MHWAAPEYAWLLLLAIPASFLLLRAEGLRRRDMILLLDTSKRYGPGRPRLTLTLTAAASLLIIATLCRPQWGQEALRQESRGLDILVALDVSRSMLADDLPPTRLAAAKRAIGGLLAQLRGDRIGLIAFAGSAFQVCPLTSDYGTFAEVLAETGRASIPLGGTTLAAPLAEARRVFAGNDGRGKYLILVSDGEDHGGDATAAAAALRGAGVTIYGLAAGSDSGGLIPLPGGTFLKDGRGAIVRSRMRAETLRDLATAGGGRLYELAGDPHALDKLYATELSSRERQAMQATRPRLADRYQYPLALAVLLLAIAPLVAGRGKP